MIILGLKFLRTCIACPEQYDVFDENKNKVGYIRLRHGYLTAEVPDSGGTEIFSHKFSDERGGFDSEEECHTFLTRIAMIIKQCDDFVDLHPGRPLIDRLIDERPIVANMMRVFGGGFAQSLSVALDRADGENILKIYNTWPDLWAQYLYMGRKKMGQIK